LPKLDKRDESLRAEQPPAGGWNGDGLRRREQLQLKNWRLKLALMSEPLWYEDGLRFTCTQCGNCCSGPEGYVWVDEEEIAALAQRLELPVAQLLKLHTRRVGKRVSLRERANGDCTFLDEQTRRCTLYDLRPKQCRTWPFWNSNLESPKAWESARQTCPGMGSGQLYQLDHIQQAAAVVDL
jgi:Fe-S-cluster containining protein